MFWYLGSSTLYAWQASVLYVCVSSYEVHIRLKYGGRPRVHVPRNGLLCTSNFHAGLCLLLRFGGRLIDFHNYFGFNRGSKCRSLVCHHYSYIVMNFATLALAKKSIFQWLTNALSYSLSFLFFKQWLYYVLTYRVYLIWNLFISLSCC